MYFRESSQAGYTRGYLHDTTVRGEKLLCSRKSMGMGAHWMKVPEELAEYKLERAELAVCLPPDWNLQSDDEKNGIGLSEC